MRAFDPNLLLGSAFPGLRAGSPAYLGYDPASAVTTASQVQALPVDALTEGGVGVPALIAVLALSGVAAFAVRRIVLGRAVASSSSSVGGAAAAPVAATESADGATAEVAEERDEDADEQAEDEDAGTTVAARTPVPA
ncbi:hypothetical protein [Actinomycetospora sp. CA-053990]|uniref:hypothetical protein n=1 Tax=Actinomycetospora sp. CA-053990 TaxID=3239891 RepID=UPI003D8FE3C5